METPLTGYIKEHNRVPPLLKEYEKAGGYAGVVKALKEMPPADIINLVKSSGLTGRGGAGFLTGLKWSLIPADDPRMRYLVANADEMEPGTFKDRYLLEGNPHQLIAGMIIASFAIKARKAYIFLRWAYKDAEKIIRKAIAEAYQAGYLGENILGTGYDLDLYIHTSAGRYICGEETALLSSLEGKRGIPRAKPPYPATSGLFGHPTVVNNVETLCWIPHIIEKGADWFLKLSLTKEGGTKLFGVSGRVKKPGLWELPMGTPLKEILNDHAGGMQEGYNLRGIIPGGASTDFLTADHLDVNMDFASVRAAGSRLGTGTMIILDDKTCPVNFIRNMIRFFAAESCGWCTPCREGLPWSEKILGSFENGTALEEDISTLEFHTHFMGPGNTFCAHAPGAMEPLQSGLKYYREDFLRHIKEKRCPWK
ncbi:MAG TPA: NADH-quinone oxidoreductase subunit NuoF [Bacteroidales bacterium]|jgi:NADH-quinone oxidoreductase subunit F|nr:NADH-quinone oxidoreductase subunit NuoF [Bacteroidales bacterium]